MNLKCQVRCTEFYSVILEVKYAICRIFIHILGLEFGYTKEGITLPIKVEINKPGDCTVYCFYESLVTRLKFE